MLSTAATAIERWDTAIELDGVTKYFDQKQPAGLFKTRLNRVTALEDVSFSVKRGEFVAYAGPNGAGKSTTFKLLCGMLAPQAGLVRAFGVDPIKRRIELMRQCGVLFGNRSELWWDHPVASSFEWKRAVWSIPDETYFRMRELVVELLDLGEFMNSFARELSLGQRMRADLGLMLLHNPSLVLLDEPTLGLDVLAKRRMIDFLKRVNQDEGVTILVTSHDMDDLTEMAQRILLINAGKIAFDGDRERLVRSAGDKRLIHLSLDGDSAPELPGATFVGRQHERFVYEYDAGAVPVSEMLRLISQLPGVRDVETARAPIESVIARMYSAWTK